MNWFRKIKIVLSAYGEFWVTDSGQAIGADGDVGDYNHEGYVIDSVRSQMMDNEDGMNAWENFIKRICKEKLEELIAENPNKKAEIIEDYENDPEEFASTILKENGFDEEDIQIAFGKGDARLYALKKWGWKIIRGRSIETFNLSNEDLKHITNGLYDAYNDEVENMNFDIFVFANKKWFNNIPWEVLSQDNIFKLREYDSSFSLGNKVY